MHVNTAKHFPPELLTIDGRPATLAGVLKATHLPVYAFDDGDDLAVPFGGRWVHVPSRDDLKKAERHWAVQRFGMQGRTVQHDRLYFNPRRAVRHAQGWSGRRMQRISKSQRRLRRETLSTK